MRASKIYQQRNSRRKTTLDEVKALLDCAARLRVTNKAKSDTCVKKARRHAMKVRLRLPIELKRRFCKHCYSYLKQGVNTRIRIHKHRVIMLCKECKKFTRIPTTRELHTLKK